MNYIVLYSIILILILGIIFDKSAFLSYLIMAIFFVLICFSYDEYDYLNYKKYYETIMIDQSLELEYLFTISMRIGNYFNLTFEQYRMIMILLEIILIHHN